MRKGKKLRIVIALRYNQPDNRARLSGALRFFAAHAAVDVRVIDSSSADFRVDCSRLMSDWAIDGIIFSYPEDIGLLLKNRGTRRPRLAMLDGPRDFGAVQVDIRMRTRNLTDGVARLLRCRGHRNFAFCGTDLPIEKDYSREIESNFRDSAAQPLAVFRESPDVSFSVNLTQAAAWVRSVSKPCAVMCYSDEVARNLLNACNLAHVHVPEQIAVVGLGNTAEICETTCPTLTSALPDFAQSGYLAAQFLYRTLVASRPGRPVAKSYGILKIIERGSTADLRGCGRLVGAATELMRTTSVDKLAADAVARQLRVSRRLLEMHFKKVIGHGVHAEIIRLRLEAIRERLQATNDPVGKIAEECGFKSYTAAQIAFRKRFGKSMTACRTP